MSKTTPILLAAAIAIVLAFGAWLAGWSPAQSVEDEPADVIEGASEGPIESSRVETVSLDTEDEEVVLDALENETFERADLATADPSPNEVSAGPRAPVRGTLRDERTSEPLPRFLLRLHDRTHREDVWTDGAGRFASSTAFLAGTVTVDPFDHPARRGRAQSFEIEHELIDGEAGEQELSVASGPTYFLVVDPETDVDFTPPPTKAPAAASSAGASEVVSASQPASKSAEPNTPPSANTSDAASAPQVTAKSAEPAAAEPPSGKLRVEDARVSLTIIGEELRDRVGPELIRAASADDGLAFPWVRFAPIAVEYERAERLELRNTDGVWRADAQVKALSGVQQAPVTLKLEARAALVGRVTDVDGFPVARAQVVLREEPDTPRDRRRETTTDGEGRYRFEYARPVACRLSARSLRHELREEDITLVAREVATRDLVLATLPPAGPIRGEIVTETGRSTPKARVRLTARDGRGGPSLVTDVAWTTHEGRKVGRFAFTALPAGPFTLSVEKEDWLKWEPQKLEVRAPREDVRVLVRDDVSLCDYVVRVRDRDNGLALDDLRLWIEFQNGPNRERRPTWDEPFERSVPIDRTFRWRIDRPGYASERGDEKAFAVEEHRDGRIVRVLELALNPGWADVVRAVRRDGRGAIEGVEILVDGTSMGKTAKDGTLRLELRDPPTAFEAKHANWRLAGQPDLRPAWKREERKFLLLRFNPAQRRKQ